MDAITLFEQSAHSAAALARTVTPDQRGRATPCTEWTVDDLLLHLAGGPAYLLGALGVAMPPGTPEWPAAAVVARCVEALRAPGALDLTCMSPAGFEWSLADAAAGTAMDQLIHTWDLAVALGQAHEMDPAITDAVIERFLPDMPEVGRQAGFVGPAVAVGPDAAPQDRLLAAMGRNPAHR